MQIKLRDLYMVAVSQSLAAICSEARDNIDEKLSYRAGKMIRAMQPVMRAVESNRARIVAENPWPQSANPDGSPAPQPPQATPAADAAFTSYLDDTMIEFDFLPLWRDGLKNAKIVNEGMLMTLEDAGLLIDGGMPIEPGASVVPLRAVE